jgi:SAM-dependent methyltransferase
MGVFDVDAFSAFETVGWEQKAAGYDRFFGQITTRVIGPLLEAVVGNFLMHHLGRPEHAIAGFARVLVPGGRLALTVWDLPDRCRLLGVVLDAIAAAGACSPPDVPAGPDFFRFSREDGFARLLNEAGLQRVEVRTLAFRQSIDSVERLWDGLMGGAVRVAALIAGQPAETKKLIRAEFDRQVSAYRTGDRLEIPVSVKLGAGQKPPG